MIFKDFHVTFKQNIDFLAAKFRDSGLLGNRFRINYSSACSISKECQWCKVLNTRCSMRIYRFYTHLLVGWTVTILDEALCGAVLRNPYAFSYSKSMTRFVDVSHKDQKGRKIREAVEAARTYIYQKFGADFYPQAQMSSTC